jgi:hypothetical protein
MGHLEACAAAGGLASLLVTPVLNGSIGVNAQLRRLNGHIVSIVAGAGAF